MFKRLMVVLPFLGLMILFMNSGVVFAQATSPTTTRTISTQHPPSAADAAEAKRIMQAYKAHSVTPHGCWNQYVWLDVYTGGQVALNCAGMNDVAHVEYDYFTSQSWSGYVYDQSGNYLWTFCNNELDALSGAYRFIGSVYLSPSGVC